AACGPRVNPRPGRHERPKLLISPYLRLIVIVTMECMAGYAALVHPARCVEITKIDKHAHRRAGRHGITLPVVERHGIDRGRPTTDLIPTAIEQVLDRFDPALPKRRVLQPYRMQLAPLPLIGVSRHQRGNSFTTI